MSSYAVVLPGSDEPVHCTNEAEVTETLKSFQKAHPDTTWSDVRVHEMRSTSGSGIERSVHDFLP
jgi:hypothetical protein